MSFPPSTPEVMRAFIVRCQALAAEQPHRWYDMGSSLKATGELSGGLALAVYDREHGQGAFASIQRRSAWGQGYAAAALAMLRFGFAQRGLQRIGDDGERPNVGSARVMEKCELRFQGERDGLRHYAVTAAEWRGDAAPGESCLRSKRCESWC